MSRIKTILESIVRSGRVAGAYLFVGPPGAGKRKAASEFSGLLGCSKINEVVVAPAGGSIKIEQIRELQKVVRYGPTNGAYLLVIVEEADKLTDQAAAAFLKTLEEPMAGVVFVLLVTREDKLPLTIISRCQKLILAEKISPWQSQAERAIWYEQFSALNSQGVLKALALATALEKEKERLEELLYDVALFFRVSLGRIRCARIILDSLRYLKRRANFKVTLDVMCLKLASDLEGQR